MISIDKQFALLSNLRDELTVMIVPFPTDPSIFPAHNC
jgi:hypothetical protein